MIINLSSKLIHFVHITPLNNLFQYLKVGNLDLILWNVVLSCIYYSLSMDHDIRVSYDWRSEMTKYSQVECIVQPFLFWSVAYDEIFGLFFSSLGTHNEIGVLNL